MWKIKPEKLAANPRPAIAAIVIQGVASHAPYLAELGLLAGKAQSEDSVSEADLAGAEGAWRRALAVLRQKLAAEPAGTAG